MANNIPQLKTDIQAAFGSNLDASTLQKFRNRFIAAYPQLWADYLAGGGTDTAANRNQFALDRLFNYLDNIYHGQSVDEQRVAIVGEHLE